MADSVFPVVYSTLTSEALVHRVLQHYAIPEVHQCQFWNRGLSDVYLVTTRSQPYVLRVSHHHWRSRSEVDFELELLDFLHQRQVPVAYPLRTREGQLFIEINAPEGKRYAALFTYAPGTIALGDLNANQAHTLGKTLATLHRAAQEFCCSSYRQSLTLEYLLDQSAEAIAPFLQARPSDVAYLHTAIAQIKAQLSSLPQEPPFWGICWGDPHSGNAHFTADDQLTLFDFDQCGYGWRAFDLAKFLQVSMQAGMSRTVRESFLRGYEMVQPLSDRELDCLQALTQTAHIWAWAIALNTAVFHHYSRLDDSYFTTRLEQLKRLTSNDWALF